MRAGIGLVPEDRKKQALFLGLAIRTNMTIAAHDQISAFRFFIDERREGKLVDEYRRLLSIRMASPDQAAGNLSGGNQQKVVLSKWLFADPEVLILDEPTRGIDVGAKYEIYTIIARLAAEGKAVIVISSEMPELLGITDRIYVMNEGRIVGEMPAADASQEKIMRAIVRGEGKAA